MKDELLKSLTKEQLERARACKSNKELLELAKEEGIELSEEQLGSVHGGACIQGKQPEHRMCPHCMSNNTDFSYYDESENEVDYYCKDCGHKWEEKLFPGRR